MRMLALESGGASKTMVLGQRFKLVSGPPAKIEANRGNKYGVRIRRGGPLSGHGKRRGPIRCDKYKSSATQNEEIDSHEEENDFLKVTSCTDEHININFNSGMVS